MRPLGCDCGLLRSPDCAQQVSKQYEQEANMYYLGRYQQQPLRDFSLFYNRFNTAEKCIDRRATMSTSKAVFVSILKEGENEGPEILFYPAL
jgi:hypothetical protein